ncbi:hypothetical protein HCN44_007935 [Aphidius gifuensis]|uniref:Uncharacterized protein n=1 Tax=Aphidius gifuensis TaxID=684658 RepID=A0A834XYK2_APHGI|nr:hypothetical protein HCN44_007935 [Aphidius gifuensis]
MATTLVPAVFSRNDLIHSNVRGGISKVKQDAERKKPQDPDRLDAIRHNKKSAEEKVPLAGRDTVRPYIIAVNGKDTNESTA